MVRKKDNEAAREKRDSDKYYDLNYGLRKYELVLSGRLTCPEEWFRWDDDDYAWVVFFHEA
jgi:hypothetical protein